MPKPTMKGSGEAYQSWNSDQATATTVMARAVKPDGLRPPVSASATSCSRSTGVAPGAVGLSAIVSPADECFS